MSTLSEAIDAIDSDGPSAPRKPPKRNGLQAPPSKPRAGSSGASAASSSSSSSSLTAFESRVRAMIANDFRGDLHSRTQAHAALKRRTVGSYFLRPTTDAPASESRVCFALSHFDKTHGIGHMLVYAHAADNGDVIFSTHAHRDAGSQFASLRDLLLRYHFPEQCKCGWRPVPNDTLAGSGAVPLSPTSPREHSSSSNSNSSSNNNTVSPRADVIDVAEPGVHFRGEFARSDAEAWLASQPPGSYVVRPSQERRDAFTVSLRERPGGLLMHVGITRSATGTWSLDSVAGPPFASLKQLLAAMPQRLVLTPLPASTSSPPATGSNSGSAFPSVTPPKPSSATKPRARALVRGVTELNLDATPQPSGPESHLYTRPPTSAGTVTRQRKLSRATSQFAMSHPTQPDLHSRQLPAVVDEPVGGGYTRPEANRTAAWQQQQHAPASSQYQQLTLAAPSSPSSLSYTTLQPEQ
jgi:hypothetical protein